MRRPPGEAYVLTDSPDSAEPWTPNRLTQALRRLRDRAGYSGRPHDLRYWNASQLLGAGESAVVVAARLGHRDPSTTAGTPTRCREPTCKLPGCWTMRSDPDHERAMRVKSGPKHPTMVLQALKPGQPRVEV